MNPVPPAAVDLYWIPLGAGGQCVRLNGRVYEAIDAARRHRPRRDLYHSALIVTLGGRRHAIELAPSWGEDPASRGVALTGPVGSHLLGWCPLFRYELRCRSDGLIPDLRYAVGGPRRLSGDPAVAQRVLDCVARVPAPVWGRDDLGTGEMWNCNSVIAWLVETAGVPAEQVGPPPNGRAPGWCAGLVVARRGAPAVQAFLQRPSVRSLHR